MKKPKVFHRVDRNRMNAYEAGQAARLANKPASCCPNMFRLVEDKGYAVILSDDWMRGWNDQNRAMKPPPGMAEFLGGE